MKVVYSDLVLAGEWWIFNSISLVVATILAENLCMQQETKEISLQPPEVEMAVV